MVTAQEMGKKGGSAKSEAKTAAARKNASKPRRKWITTFHYGVTGADWKMHVGHVVLFFRFSLDLTKNADQLYDIITEDMIANGESAGLPWVELLEFGGVAQPIS